MGMAASFARGTKRHRRASALLAIATGTVAAALGTLQPVHADGPGSGTPWVVTVGDSYISGEAGRWAGNTNNGEQYIDALGPTAYYDNAGNTAEQIYRCHRSHSAEAYIGGGVTGLDLACSGAQTSTYWTSQNWFKPGLDFYDDGAGDHGQARMLQDFAASHNVRMVAISIGGNNYNFASIVQTCVTDFLTTPSWWPSYCKDDSSVQANFSSGNVAAQTANIKNAILNISTAMSNAGYTTSQYGIVVQDYMSPIPYGSAFRYPESGYSRQSTGGCGFWSPDADWANNSALPTIDNSILNAAAQTGLSNVVTMDLAAAFNGRRLCENTVGLLEEQGLTYWTDPGAVDLTEWINQIRTVSTATSDYYIQESLHPNYGGQLALRNCLRQAYNGGAVRGGTCGISSSGLNGLGEPNMALN
jgi:hypothetical protein